MHKTIEFTLNGRIRRVDIQSNQVLLNLIRDDLGLTGTKYGCGIGECGSCTVFIDGKPLLSCLVLAAEVAGKDVKTIEDRSSSNITDLQRYMLEEGAIQCGFCTPGFAMVTQSLLERNPHPSEEEIRQYLKGNLCRCTGYTSIVKAIKRMADNG